MKLGSLRFYTAAIGALVFAVGCSGSSPAGSTSNEHFVIKIASADPNADTAEAKGAQAFLDEITKKSGGRLTGQLYLNGQLGNTPAMVQGVEQGTIQMNYTDVSALAGPVPQLAALTLPFLFSSQANAEKVYDGPIGAQLNQALIKTAGVRVLGWHTTLARDFVTVNKPLLSLNDFKGEKMRIVASATTLAAYKAWGAVPVTLDATEINTGLKQGTIDGFDQPFVTLYSYGWYQVVKYVTESNHTWVFPPFFINEKFFESLPSDLQQIVLTAGANSIKVERTLAAQQSDDAKQKIIASGVKVMPFDPASAAQLRTAAAPAYDAARVLYGAQFMSDLLAAAAG